MDIARSKALWVGLAAGGSLAALIIFQRKRNHRASPSRERYGNPGQALDQDRSRYVPWRFDQRFAVLAADKALRLELSSPAIVHWTVDQWDTVQDTRTTRAGSGLHVADLPTENLKVGTRVQFTFYWPEVSRWEGEDFEVKVDYARQYAT